MPPLHRNSRSRPPCGMTSILTKADFLNSWLFYWHLELCHFPYWLQNFTENLPFLLSNIFICSSSILHYLFQIIHSHGLTSFLVITFIWQFRVFSFSLFIVWCCNTGNVLCLTKVVTYGILFGQIRCQKTCRKVPKDGFDRVNGNGTSSSYILKEYQWNISSTMTWRPPPSQYTHWTL